jgi:HJR/Mrr/RecB family endonuclease
MLARFESRLRLPGSFPLASGAPRMPAIVLGALAALLAAWLLVHYLFRPHWLVDLPQAVNELLVLFEWSAFLTLGVIALFLNWRARRERAPHALPLSPDDLYQLTPKAFEQYVAGLFRKKGYKVRVRGRSGDHGVDLELEQPGRRAIVQCKRYRHPIGPDIVRELFGTMIHERVHHAFLVTTAEISQAARDWARDKPMTLIDGSTLVEIARSLANDPS